VSFVNEMKRRKVLQVAAIYVSAAFAILEGVGVLIAGFSVPEGAIRVVSILAFAGFPVAIALTWLFQVDAEGVRATAAADTPEGRAELAAAAHHSLLDGRTLLVAGVLAVFGIGLGAGWFLNPGGSRQIDDGPSIAVLPFEDRSSDEDALFFVDGIHDELLNQLSKIGALRVISRASLMSYRDEPKPIREIGEELGVRTVLAGGVQRAADRVRVSVQLVDAGTDTQLWAQSYEQSLSPDNLFFIQRDVSERISDALRAELTPDEAAALKIVPTHDQEAYDLYIKGNAAYRRDEIVEAADFYEAAVEVDQEFALAWASLAEVHAAHYHFHFDRTAGRLERARAALDRAFALEPSLPEAYSSQALYRYWVFRDYEAALEAADRAEAGRPNDPRVLLTRAAILRRMGLVRESIDAFLAVIRVDPRDANAMGNLAALYTAARLYDDAAPWRQRALERLPHSVQYVLDSGLNRLYASGQTGELRTGIDAAAGLEDPFGMTTLAAWQVAHFEGRYEDALAALRDTELEVLEYQTYYYPVSLLAGLTHREAGDAPAARREFEAARSSLEDALAETPDEPRLLAALGQALAGLGERDAAVAAGVAATEAMPISLDALDGPEYVFELAKTYSLLGESEAAIARLLVYFGGMGRWSPDGLLADPAFRPLAGHPLFRQVEGAAEAWQRRMAEPVARRT